jgi:hypothetical protein
MSVRHERLIELCNELRLGGIAAQYPALAQYDFGFATGAPRKQIMELARPTCSSRSSNDAMNAAR